jgi:predicted amidohydrolase YtcJ
MSAQRAVIYPAKMVLTMDDDLPLAQAVGVIGDRIAAVGTEDEVRRVMPAGTSTDRTLEDHVVLPGFIDQHLHPILGASSMATEVIAIEDWVMPDQTFPGADSPQRYWELLREANQRVDDDDWLFSWGYHPLWHGPMTKSRLDEVSSTRPIAIWHRSVHEWYLNSAAVQALGLDREQMASSGAAATMMDWDEGHWWETGMNLILPSLMPQFLTPARMTLGLKRMVVFLHANGVTAINEPGILLFPGLWELYQQILGDPDTPFLTSFIVDSRQQVDAGLDVEQSLADTKRQIAMAPAGKVSFFDKQMKLFADGAIVSQQMKMKDGYFDAEGNVDPHHEGEWLMTPENLRERALFYFGQGFQLHIHVNGDLGLEVLLDIIEECVTTYPRDDHRTVIVHFANSTEEQVARIKELGCIVSANPYYTTAFADMYGEFGLGPERADQMVRSASVVRAGIPLSFHSDMPIAPSDPINFMWCAMNRITTSGRVAAPEQRIDLDSALRAITIEAAFSWRREHELGSIAVGKKANFTVLDTDPHTLDPSKIRDLQILGTVFEGRWFPAPPVRRNAGATPIAQTDCGCDVAAQMAQAARGAA